MLSFFTRDNFFTVLSLILAFVFGWGFFSVAGFPPTHVADNLPSLLVFLLFSILPFAQKLALFNFLTFEARLSQVHEEVEETKEKVSEIKLDLRHVVTQQQVLSTAVQSISNQAVTVNNNYDRPAQAQLEAAVEEVEDIEPVELPDAGRISADLTSDNKLLEAIFGRPYDLKPEGSEDPPKLADLYRTVGQVNEVLKMALVEQVAVLRIHIEGELKRILLSSFSFSSSDPANTRNIRKPQRIMVKEVALLFPEIERHTESFDVFFRIANAAIHADDVPFEDLQTAAHLGGRLLSVLQKIPGGQR